MIYRNAFAVASFAIAMAPLFLVAEDSDTSATEKKTFEISGTLESTKAVEVMLETEEIASVELRRIVPHGSKVKKGQAIAWFDTTDIDERIAKETVDLRLAELAMESAEFAFDQFIATQALDREAADRAMQAAQQAYDNYIDIDRDAAIESVEQSLKSARESLEGVQEELEQLQKMYEEDDLTEESEEIVLKRAKSAVESAEYRLKLTKVRAKRTLEQDIPAQAKAEEDKLARAELAHAKSLRDLSDAKTRKEIEHKRQQEALDKQIEKLASLKQERQQLTLQSPMDGLVYHGQLTRGRLSDKPSTLEVGKAVTPEQVLYTVVAPNALQVRAELTPEQVGKLSVGRKGTLKLASLPGSEVPATIKMLNTIPFSNNKFDCVLTVQFPKAIAAKVVPGLNGSVVFVEASESASDDESNASKEQ